MAGGSGKATGTTAKRGGNAVRRAAAKPVAVGPHFTHDTASVCLHGDLADAKFSTNLLIQQSRHHNAMTSCSRRLSDA